jgi:hypothetical protein
MNEVKDKSAELEDSVLGLEVKVKQIDELKDKYSKLEQKLLRIEGELRKKQSTEAKLLEYAVDNSKFEEVIKEQEKRMLFLGNRLQVYINRECVLTEVSRYVRRLGSLEVITEFHLKLMNAFNYGDEFWEQYGSSRFTLRQWFDKIMALSDVSDPKPDEVIKLTEMPNEDIV